MLRPTLERPRERASSDDEGRRLEATWGERTGRWGGETWRSAGECEGAATRALPAPMTDRQATVRRSLATMVVLLYGVGVEEGERGCTIFKTSITFKRAFKTAFKKKTSFTYTSRPDSQRKGSATRSFKSQGSPTAVENDERGAVGLCLES